MKSATKLGWIRWASRSYIGLHVCGDPQADRCIYEVKIARTTLTVCLVQGYLNKVSLASPLGKLCLGQGLRPREAVVH